MVDFAEYYVGRKNQLSVVIAGVQGLVIPLPYPAILTDSVSAVRETGDNRMPSLCIRS